MSKKFSYDNSIQELNQIVSDIQQGNVGLDELSEKIKKANVLIQQCKTKLREIDKELNDLNTVENEE